jgi:hypothetical protein
LTPPKPPAGKRRFNTPLNITSRYFNAAAIDVLCDKNGNTEFRNTMKSKDSSGNAAFNLATTGYRFMLPADQIVL